jgi:DNA-directed RNA polymerase subunit RPC12/RpoP
MSKFYESLKRGLEEALAWEKGEIELRTRTRSTDELRTCYCPICDKHFKVRSNDSGGSCPDCGHHVVLLREDDNDAV